MASSKPSDKKHGQNSKKLKTKRVLSEAWTELSPARGDGGGFKLDEAKIRAKGKSRQR